MEASVWKESMEKRWAHTEAVEAMQLLAEGPHDRWSYLESAGGEKGR